MFSIGGTGVPLSHITVALPSWGYDSIRGMSQKGSTSVDLPSPTAGHTTDAPIERAMTSIATLAT